MDKGLDLSHHQNDKGTINFDKIKASGYSFVIIKATEGSESGSKYLDPYFKSNLSKAKNAGLYVHAYHFFRGVSDSDAQEEANWFAKNVSPSDVDYVFCDVEYDKLSRSKQSLTNYVNSFFTQLSKKGYTRLGVYTSLSFMNDRMVESDLNKGIKKWIARYNTILGRDADVWQYSSSGKVDGVVGSVDVDKDITGILSHAVGKPSSKAIKKPLAKPVSKSVVPTTIRLTKYSVTADVLNIRHSPNGKIIGRLKKGQTVEVVSISGNWAKVKSNRTFVYVSRHYLSKVSSSPAKPKATKRPYHIVVKGDSLWLIANNNRTTVASLKRINKLKSDVIHPNQKIYLK